MFSDTNDDRDTVRKNFNNKAKNLRHDINNSTRLLSEPLSYTPRKHAPVNSFVLWVWILSIHLHRILARSGPPGSFSSKPPPLPQSPPDTDAHRCRAYQESSIHVLDFFHFAKLFAWSDIKYCAIPLLPVGTALDNEAIIFQLTAAHSCLFPVSEAQELHYYWSFSSLIHWEEKCK